MHLFVPSQVGQAVLSTHCVPGTVLVLVFKISAMAGVLFFLLISSQPGRGRGQGDAEKSLQGSMAGRILVALSEGEILQGGIRKSLQRRVFPWRPEDSQDSSGQAWGTGRVAAGLGAVSGMLSPLKVRVSRKSESI